MSKFLKSIFVTAIGLSFFLILLGMNDALAQVKIAKKTVKPPPEEEVQGQVSLEPVDSGEGILGSWGTTPFLQHCLPQIPKGGLFHKRAENVHWARTYGGNFNDLAYDILQTNDGGYIVSAMTQSFGVNKSNAWVVKLSPLGIIEWQKIYGGEGQDSWYNSSILQAEDGGYIVLSDLECYEAERAIWILKLFPDGNIEWQYVYDINFANNISNLSYPCGIVPLDDGGYLVCGNARTDYGPNIVVFKIDVSGAVKWAKNYGPDLLNKIANKIISTPDNGFAISFSLYEQGFSGGIMKIDKNGDILWQKKFTGGGRFIFFGSFISPTLDGGFIHLDYTDLLGQGLYDFIVTRMDSEGNAEWQKVYGGPDEEYYTSVIRETAGGGFIFAGITKSFASSSMSQFWIVNTDSEGNITWEKTFVSEGCSQPFCLIQAEDGDFIVGGYRGSSYDMMILKVSPLGEIGPCPLMGNSTAGVMDVSTEVINTGLVADDLTVSKRITKISTKETDSGSQLLCWNLHQPPENVSVTQKSNKSFFKTEYYNRISWSPNSWNGSFDVTHYRIYRDEGGSGYQLLAEVAGSTTEFLDGPVGGQNAYYTIVSVVEGVESPRSEPVK